MFHLIITQLMDNHYPDHIIEFLPSHVSLELLVTKAKEKRRFRSKHIENCYKPKQRCSLNSIYLRKLSCL